MLTTELYYLKIEDKLAHLYKVVHLFSPDLMLAKVLDFDGGEEPINELMYCEIERTEDGDPHGWFFDSIEPAMLLAGWYCLCGELAAGIISNMATKKPKTAELVVDVKPKIDPFYKTPGAIDDLCGYIATGGHLAGFCRERGLLYTSVSDWI